MKDLPKAEAIVLVLNSAEILEAGHAQEQMEILNLEHIPDGSDGKSVCLQCGRPGFDPWVGKIRKWQPTPVLLPGKTHGWGSLVGYRSVQFSSVAQSCLTLCDPMNCSMPGLPVHHQLPEFIQTHAHRGGDAIQPSHPLSSPSPPAPNPTQHQFMGLQRVRYD